VVAELVADAAALATEWAAATPASAFLTVPEWVRPV
jgi:hypothetical protein